MFLDNINTTENTEEHKLSLLEYGFRLIDSYEIITNLRSPFEVRFETNNAQKRWNIYSIILALVGIFTTSPVAILAALIPFMYFYNLGTIRIELRRLYAEKYGLIENERQLNNLHDYEKRRSDYISKAEKLGIKIPKIGPKLYLSDLEGRLNSKKYNFVMSKKFNLFASVLVVITAFISVIGLITFGWNVLLFITAILETAALIWIQYKVGYGVNTQLLKAILAQQDEQLDTVLMKYNSVLTQTNLASLTKLDVTYATSITEQLMQDDLAKFKNEEAPQ